MKRGASYSASGIVPHACEFVGELLDGIGIRSSLSISPTMPFSDNAWPARVDCSGAGSGETARQQVIQLILGRNADGAALLTGKRLHLDGPVAENEILMGIVRTAPRVDGSDLRQRVLIEKAQDVRLPNRPRTSSGESRRALRPARNAFQRRRWKK